MLDGDEDRVQEDQNNNEPVETLVLNKATYAKPENTHVQPKNTNNNIINSTVLRECKPPPRRLTSTKNDLGFESGYRDKSVFVAGCLPDRCQNAVRWIHYLISVSHFAECRENQLVTVREMLINLLKSHIP